MNDSKPNESSAIEVPMPDVVKFVRQLSHDLRNHLNAAELQCAFLNEISDEAEVKTEVKRLREILAEMAASLQKITTRMGSVKLTEMPYEASSFIEDLRQKIGAQFPQQTRAIEWEGETPGAILQIDPQILQQAFLELFANAFEHDPAPGPLRVKTSIEAKEFVFKLEEPKTKIAAPLESWGRAPLRSSARGHYGLGLNRALHIIESHRGRFEVCYDSGTLVTTIALPLEASK